MKRLFSKVPFELTLAIPVRPFCLGRIEARGVGVKVSPHHSHPKTRHPRWSRSWNGTESGGIEVPSVTDRPV